MHLWDWIIVVALNGSVIAYGFYLARGTKGSSDWFLGRRALPWWAIGLSMYATNVDNADIVSITGKTFNEGLHIITVYALGSFVGGILAAFYVTPIIYRAGFYTNAEYLEARYGVGTRVISALIQIQYRSSMLGMMMYSFFLLLTGLDILGPAQSWGLIVVLVICSGLYTCWGGLKSVVWTDAMQAIVMMIGGVVIFVAVWQAVGGWRGMEAEFAKASAEQNKPFTDLPHISTYDGGNNKTSPYLVSLGSQSFNIGPFVVILGWTIIASGYWTVNHTQTMRLMGSRSLWDMKMAALAGVLFSLPIMIGSACLGIFGKALALRNPTAAVWQEAAQTPDKLYPLLANEFLSIGLKGLVVAAIVAAAVSTFDSMGSALSAVFTRDIYARLLVPNKEDRHYVLIGRFATVGVLLLGFAYLPFILMQKNMLDAFTTLIPVFVTPLFTIYVIGALSRAHRRAGIVGLLCGSAFGVFALYCREAPRMEFLPNAAWAPLWLTDRWAALCWSFLITSAVMLVCTLILGRQPKSDEFKTKQTGWLERSRETLPPLREHPFSGRIPWWANTKIYVVLLLVICVYVVFGLFW